MFYVLKIFLSCHGYHCIKLKRTTLFLLIPGLTLAGGLVVFVSVVSDVASDHPRHSPSRFEYRYGWAFQGAAASCGMAEVRLLKSHLAK